MAEEIKEKKCACKGGNLDRFIQPIILLILAEEADTGYGVFKKMGEFSMFRESRPDATGVYRYLRIMEQRELLEQFESLSLIHILGRQALTGAVRKQRGRK